MVTSKPFTVDLAHRRFLGDGGAVILRRMDQDSRMLSGRTTPVPYSKSAFVQSETKVWDDAICETNLEFCSS